MWILTLTMLGIYILLFVLNLIYWIWFTFEGCKTKKIEHHLMEQFRPKKNEIQFSHAVPSKKFPHYLWKLDFLYSKLSSSDLDICHKMISLEMKQIESESILGITKFGDTSSNSLDFSKAASPIGIVVSVLYVLSKHTITSIELWMQLALMCFISLLYFLLSFYINNLFTSLRYFQYQSHLMIIEKYLTTK